MEGGLTMGEDYRYSLCLALPFYNGRPIFYRLADYKFDTKVLEEAQYTSKDDNYYEPLYIGSIENEFEPYQCKLRRWIPKPDDPTKQLSYSYDNFDGDIYEVIKVKEINPKEQLDDNQLRNILYEGITLEQFGGENFLLVIGENNSHYTVLNFNKRHLTESNGRYCIEKYVDDMFHTIHCVNKLSVPKNDIISTNALNTVAHVFNTKYFYNKTYLNIEGEKFNLREPYLYVRSYFSKYLKKKKNQLQFTYKEIKRFINAITDASQDNNEIEEFFYNTGYSTVTMQKVLEDNLDEISNMFLQSDIYSLIIEECLIKNPYIYEQCKSIVRQDWLQQKDQEKDEIQHQIDILKEEYNEALSSIKETEEMLAATNNSLNEKLEQLKQNDEQLNEALMRKERIDQEISEQLIRFKEDIVRTTELIGVSQATCNISFSSLSSTNKENGIYILNERRLSGDEEYIEDLKDFSEVLKDNLEIVGITNQHSLDMAITITAALTSGKSIIVADNIAISIADAISSLLEACSATVVSIPMGYTNLSELINIVKNINTKVILIENAFESFNEGLLTTIAKHCNEKYLIFTYTSLHNIEAFSGNIWSYFVLIETDNFLTFPNNNSFKISEVILNNLYIKSDNKVLKRYLRMLLPFVQNNFITTKVALNIVNIMDVYYQMIATEKLGIFIIIYMFIIARTNIKADEELFNKFIEIGIDDDYINILKKVR